MLGCTAALEDIMARQLVVAQTKIVVLEGVSTVKVIMAALLLI
jgi:hypothetical protein